jgi:hypothetical protein
MLTAEKLRQLLDYDPATGVFTWKFREEVSRNEVAWNRRFLGKIAGRTKPNKNGYLELAIDGVLYYSHRLAWLYMTDEWPEDQIDHKNLNKADNRFENLREATAPNNGWNTRALKRGKSGFKGVSICNGSQIVASICVSGKRMYLGSFKTTEEAHAAYVAAAKKYHGEFARVA